MPVINSTSRDKRASSYRRAFGGQTSFSAGKGKLFHLTRVSSAVCRSWQVQILSKSKFYIFKKKTLDVSPRVRRTSVKAHVLAGYFAITPFFIAGLFYTKLDPLNNFFKQRT